MANIFGIDYSVLDVSELYINGESIGQLFASNTRLTQFYQPKITQSNLLSYNLISEKPDLNQYVQVVNFNNSLNNLIANSNIQQILLPYSLKSEVSSQVAAKSNAIFDGNCTFNSNLRIRGGLALENNLAVLNGYGIDSKILNGYGIDDTLKTLKDLGVLDVEDKVLALIKKYVQYPTGENPFSGDIVNEGK